MKKKIFKRKRNGFKICRKFFKDDYRSAFTDGNVVNYFLGEWIEKPKKCGPLAVFDTIEHVNQFLWYGGGYNNQKIFKCKYIKSKETYLYTMRPFISSRFILPKGTCLADKVKLIEQVNWLGMTYD